VNKVLRKNIGRGPIKIVRFNKIQILGKYLKQILAALFDIVRQQLDAVDAHQPEE
jgi:hypothetical protein